MSDPPVLPAVPWDRDRDGPEPEEPSDAELLGIWPDPFAGHPDGADEWLADLSVPELDVVAARWAAESGAAVAGPLALEGFAAEAYDEGLGRLSDDELVGVLCAARRLTSWQTAIEIAAAAELDARRQAGHPISPRLNEHVSTEIAAALTLAGRAAEELLALARCLARLPMVLAALADGRIDREDDDGPAARWPPGPTGRADHRTAPYLTRGQPLP